MSDDLMRESMTGMLFFRDAAIGHTGGKDVEISRRLMMVLGVVAVPGSYQVKGEHQYVIVGGSPDTIGTVDIKLHIERPISPPESTIGYDASGILCAPIWRT